jgi:cobalt-precorrin 5A hydrolase
MTLCVIGLGCQRGCPATVLRELIDSSLAERGMSLADISALASIDTKADEPGLLELAKGSGLKLVFFSADKLAPFEYQLSQRSQFAFDNTGCYGVAESAALALVEQLSGSPATLMIRRRKNAKATFALACALQTVELP